MTSLIDYMHHSHDEIILYLQFMSVVVPNQPSLSFGMICRFFFSYLGVLVLKRCSLVVVFIQNIYQYMFHDTITTFQFIAT